MDKVNYRWDFCCPGMSCSVDWWLITEVSGQHIGPIFKGQAVYETLVTNYKSTLHNIPEERRSHVQCG